ncbi:MAG TPA: MATE family efflux transporter [Gemmatimonadales bacterium]|nr:MATE family efflux transporter [Gemmatimonadales bacterium]
MFRTRREDVVALLRLAVPVVVVQVGIMFMGTVDTLMVGRLSPTALAAVAVGNLYSVIGIFFGQGILLALDPLINQAHGAGDRPAVVRAFQRAMLLALVLAIPITLYHLLAGPILTALRQPGDVIPLADAYDRWLVPGVLPFLAFGVLRGTMQAFHRLRPVVVTIIIANLANALLNWIFIYGHFGAPAFGVPGSALATTISRWLMVLLLLALARDDFVPLLRPWHTEAHDRTALVRMLRIGVPIALQYELEIACFGGVAFLAGAMGTIQVASHQIAINLAALTYMVPLGVSAAATVLVGRAVGAGDPDEVRRRAQTSIIVGAGFMATTALLFVTLPGFLAALYTNDAGVLALATVLIPLAGIFQVFDGVQVVAIGVLRGLADTRTPFVISLIGYWLIGMPVGIILAYVFKTGVAGLWWGLVIGLGAVAGILVHRVRAALGTPDRWTV